MTHINRGRITVDTTGDWRQYTSVLPAHSSILGTVTLGNDIGALVMITTTGQFKQVIDGVCRPLDERKTSAALGEARAGRRGGQLGGGKRAADGVVGMTRTNISIDALSKEILREYGDGDLSLGIRKAARLVELLKI